MAVIGTVVVDLGDPLAGAEVATVAVLEAAEAAIKNMTMDIRDTEEVEAAIKRGKLCRLSKCQKKTLTFLRI